jgi:glycosyltransferase involved in cell wall biosynthesis
LRYFVRILRAVRKGDRLLFHGCLGALHFTWSGKTAEPCKGWIKLGLLEEMHTKDVRFHFRKWIEKLNFHAFGLRIVVSRQLGDFLSKEYGWSASGTFVIPCLVDRALLSPSHDRTTARKTLGFEDRIVFLYLGIAAPWQCPEETVAFFRQIRIRFPSAFLWILTPDKEYFSRLVDDLPKEHCRIEFRPHDTLADRIHAADFGFLLRRKDLINHVASPVKFPEYLASGLPVIIGPEVGDYTELVREKGLGVIVDPDAPEKWNHAIDQIITLMNESAFLHQRCREVSVKLSWEFFSEKIKQKMIDLDTGRPHFRIHRSENRRQPAGSSS